MIAATYLKMLNQILDSKYLTDRGKIKALENLETTRYLENKGKLSFKSTEKAGINVIKFIWI